MAEKILTIVIRHREGSELAEARLEGQHKTLVVSRQPFLDAARALLPIGMHDPSTVLVSKREGSDTECLRGRIIDVAKWTVTERTKGSPRFERWAPHQVANGFQ